ncbi:MAG: hypothetical protein NT154_39850 [Verrucomicrobia bacterium]|nr:hypothetical protein [Verrucomicrobiota bacterium]
MKEIVLFINAVWERLGVLPGGIQGPRRSPFHRDRVSKGTIRRLTRGLYDYPKSHLVIAPLAPSPDASGKARLEMAGFLIS